MTWSYQQSTGDLRHDDEFEGRGYSGHGAGLNQPAEQNVVRVGPIPQGDWTIGVPKNPPDHLGRLAMPLKPVKGTETFGRSGFFIHGDNPKQNHSASDGCIILGHAQRQLIADSQDRDLRVIA